MDCQRFIDQLPELYENWGQESVRPKSDQFQQVLKEIRGFTTANVMQLLNFAVGCMEPGEVYCETGCSQGASLIGALLDQGDRRAYAVAPLSASDLSGTTFKKLVESLAKFHLKDQVLFYDKEVEEFFINLSKIETKDKIGVYFCNAFQDYRSQLLSLLQAQPFFADRALIIISDSNWSAVQQSSWDFISSHPQCQLLLDLPTPRNGHRAFWNGLQILGWERTAKCSQDWSRLKRFRNHFVVQASPFRLRFKPPDSIYVPANFVQIENFLPLEEQEKVLAIALENENSFVESGLANERQNVNTRIRKSTILYLEAFPEFMALIRSRVLETLPEMLEKLGHPSFPVSQMDIQMTAHHDGCYYTLHADAAISDFTALVNREISYVYYFNQEPKAFSGGQLRLYDTEITSPTPAIHGGFRVIEPKNNSIVFFNSRNLHEVMPVACPSNTFADGRFTVNGWLYA